MTTTEFKPGRAYRTVGGFIAQVETLQWLDHKPAKGLILKGCVYRPYLPGEIVRWTRAGTAIGQRTDFNLTDVEVDPETGEPIRRTDEAEAEAVADMKAADDETPAGAPTPFALKDAPGYEKLAEVLRQAFAQAATGKGSARHSRGEPFHEQPIAAIARRRGVGFNLGQVEKKVDEAHLMFYRGETSRAEAELLGAINYLAACIIVMREQDAADFAEIEGE